MIVFTGSAIFLQHSLLFMERVIDHGMVTHHKIVIHHKRVMRHKFVMRHDTSKSDRMIYSRKMSDSLTYKKCISQET